MAELKSRIFLKYYIQYRTTVYNETITLIYFSKIELIARMPLGLKNDFKMQFLERISLEKNDMHMDKMQMPKRKI
jgi:hypothetical protein